MLWRSFLCVLSFVRPSSGGRGEGGVVRPPAEVVQRYVEVVGQRKENLKAGRALPFFKQTNSFIRNAEKIANGGQRCPFLFSQRSKTFRKNFSIFHSIPLDMPTFSWYYSVTNFELEFKKGSSGRCIPVFCSPPPYSSSMSFIRSVSMASRLENRLHHSSGMAASVAIRAICTCGFPCIRAAMAMVICSSGLSR